jgi:hypothetical protein
MCIIIANTAGKLPAKTMGNCWQANPDGAGMAWSEKGKLKVYKSMEEEDFTAFYNSIRDRHAGTIVLHWRIGTSGQRSKLNVHPFWASDELVMCHNGILDIEVPAGSDLNDTQIFNNHILKGLPKNFLGNESIIWLLEAFCKGSKLVFLKANEELTIINEGLGKWEGKNWYSNDSHKVNYGYPKQDFWKIDYCHYCGKKLVGKEKKNGICSDCMADLDLRYDDLRYDFFND